MIVELRSENGHTMSEKFMNMDTAAAWCMAYPEYGITLIEEDLEPEWDRKEWQEWLNYYAA